jgi:O-antigen/teichoic acid export membrane protein
MTSFVRRLPGVTRDVPAGLIDAGTASLAHFLVGLASVNLLDEANLGVYAVFFAAFMVAAIVPQFLIFTPAEVQAVSYPVKDRLIQLPQSLRLGFGPTATGALAILVAAVSTASETTWDVTVAFALTAGLAVLVSPAQDHLRRLLHIARRSWAAAGVSIAQLTVVAIGIGAMVIAGVPSPWVPFGALATANILSFSLGLFIARDGRSGGEEPPLKFRDLIRSGRWLLAMALVPFGASFIGTLLIVELAGPEAMGYAEAARVAAQPILVLGTGLSAVLGPRGIEAAVHRNRPQAQKALRIFLGLIGISGILYLAVVGHPWIGNPMVYMVPVAYEVSGLVAVTIVAHILTAAAVQYTSELMGGRKEVGLTKMSLIASPFLLLGSATAAFTEAFARAIGIILEASARYGLYGIIRERMYREPQPITQEDGAA